MALFRARVSSSLLRSCLGATSRSLSTGIVLIHVFIHRFATICIHRLHHTFICFHLVFDFMFVESSELRNLSRNQIIDRNRD